MYWNIGHIIYTSNSLHIIQYSNCYNAHFKTSGVVRLSTMLGGYFGVVPSSSTMWVYVIFASLQTSLYLTSS